MLTLIRQTFPLDQADKRQQKEEKRYSWDLNASISN